jgi:endonuclease/exonuclease/phosphatase (EEP) superfamily protein YafD
VVIDVDGEPVTIFSTHPVPPIGAGFSADRNTQLDYIADRVVATSGSTLVIGDLNITPWAAHYRDFEKKTGLVNTQRGSGLKPSWPLFLPIAMIPIDHALVSADLVAAETRTLSRIGSDHLPLFVRIARR